MLEGRLRSYRVRMTGVAEDRLNQPLLEHGAP
jgi:hypothetical protein